VSWFWRLCPSGAFGGWSFVGSVGAIGVYLRDYRAIGEFFIEASDLHVAGVLDGLGFRLGLRLRLDGNRDRDHLRLGLGVRDHGPGDCGAGRDAGSFRGSLRTFGRFLRGRGVGFDFLGHAFEFSHFNVRSRAGP
jgi:hypothetical protein